jgi:hypothetical protein
MLCTNTLSEAKYNTTPTGMNMSPTIKKVGITVLGVRIGCQDFSLCCLNAVSMLRGDTGWFFRHTRKTPMSNSWTCCLRNGKVYPLNIADKKPEVISAAEKIKRSISLTLSSNAPLEVLVVTWNMNQKIPQCLDELFGQIDLGADFIAIGVQECGSVQSPTTKDWEHLLDMHFSNYKKISSVALLAIHLVVYAKTLVNISGVSTAKIGTGIGNMLGNKGAVGIALRVGRKSILFVNSHFAAHLDNLKVRNKDFNRINRALHIKGIEKSSKYSIVDNYDHVFWFGDLNYRVVATRKIASELLDNNSLHVRDRVTQVLLAIDQLSIERKKRTIFEGFEEGKIEFQPTYKFVNGNYDNERVPSWTDRILFSSGISCRNYSSCENTTSDHKAVYGLYQIQQYSQDKQHSVKQFPHQVSTGL